MVGLIAVGVSIALATGAAVKFVMDQMGGTKRITRNELIVGAAALSLVIVPLTAYVGREVSISANSQFHEYWNGWETQAATDITVCDRDGSCSHTYQCDPYPVVVTYTTTDSKGRTQTRTRTEIHYHSCPVGSEEATYIVRTTVGDSVISRNQFTPDTVPWRDGKSLGDVPTQPPAAWVAARDRLAAGNAGPATSVHTYENWILASQETILRRYSDAIDSYKANGLLPPPAVGVRDFYLADKTHFVGWQPKAADAAAWQDAVNRVGAALGSQKQGDLEVVLVRSSKVTNPDEYTSALMASWQDPDLGKDALAKNAVVLIAGTTDGKTVAWARVATGMPVGNAELQVAARTELDDAPWTPAQLIGVPTVKVTGDAVSPAPATTKGALEALLWDRTNGFVRVCMTCEGSTDDGALGYEYLRAEIKPTAGQNAAIIAMMTFLAGGVWAAFGYAGDSALAPVRRYVTEHRDPYAARLRSHAAAAPRRTKYRRR